MKIIKNDIYDVNIEDMGNDGEGIGKIEGYTIFVKDTVIGDFARVKVIKANKNYGYGKVESIIKPSTFRVEPICNIARQCGGCQLQHMEYSKQLEYKHNKIKNCLERIGKFNDIDDIIEPIMGMDEPFHYRNKAQFPVGVKDGKIITGFYAGRTHSIIDTSHCYIQAEINTLILEKVKHYIEESKIKPYDENTHTGVIRHVLTRVSFTTGEIMVCLVVNALNIPNKERLIDSLCEIEGMSSIVLNINREKTNVILGEKVIKVWGEGYITDYIGDIRYRISPLSFFQVNSKQTGRLYDKVLEYAGLTGEEIVWDLYCGIGTISLFLARNAKIVYGVEVVADAILDAKENARINGIGNTEFLVGKSEDVLTEFFEEGKIDEVDVIVVDPPRKGCDEKLLRTIVGIRPKRIVYVSCDPGTLSRDLRYLADEGYRVERVCGVDMFGHSVHVETVCLLTRES